MKRLHPIARFLLLQFLGGAGLGLLVAAALYALDVGGMRSLSDGAVALPLLLLAVTLPLTFGVAALASGLTHLPDPKTPAAPRRRAARLALAPVSVRRRPGSPRA